MNPSKLLKNRLALSTVVTTLIILVVSVLLATVVTYFAINVVSTRAQEESLHPTKQHIWHNATAPAGSTGYSVASVMVINTGGRDVVIDKISVRGQECFWNSTTDNKFVLYHTTTDAISSDMPYVGNFSLAGANQVTLGSTTYDFKVASTDLVLKSGGTLLIYIVNPDSIAINDVGLTVSIAIHSAQAMYYLEANVEAVAM
jgi:hypothetical protein